MKKTTEMYVEPVGFKGTPGKWLFDGLEIIMSKGEEIIADIRSCNHDGNELEHLVFNKNQQEAEANAELISQSKEIAKALQDAMTIIKRLDTWHHLENGVFTYTDPNRDGDQLTIDLQESLANAKQVLKDAGLE